MSFSLGKAFSECFQPFIAWDGIFRELKALQESFFFLTSELFILVKNNLGRKTNETGEIWGCLKPKFCSLLVVESDGWI